MTESRPEIVPIILCGGSGTRLWPLSRRLSPKQFIRLPDGETLFAKTLSRAKKLGWQRGVIVGAEEHKFQIRKILSEQQCESWPVICEPSSQNTAAAIALAAKYVRDSIGERAMLVLPADHLIAKDEALGEQAVVAAQAALAGHIVTFGITPTRVETGYGYIELSGEAAENGVHTAVRFKEKPEKAACEQMLAAGDNWLWNSGMFCMTPDCYLRQLGEMAPDVLETVEAAYGVDSAGEVVIDADIFARCPNSSVDYALMEKVSDIKVIRAEFEWSDVGSWLEFARLMGEDDAGNRVSGRALTHECSNSLLMSERRFVAALGLKDMLVIETPDAVLVASKDSVREVREVVAKVKSLNSDLTDTHLTVYRPWGSYTCVDADDNFQVKRIVVAPGESLSLQRHQHRSEHWVVVRGTVRVTCDDKVFDLRANESTYIPIRSIHRLENLTKEKAYLIEVQCGDYLGEDDIERFSDNYGRTTQS